MFSVVSHSARSKRSVFVVSRVGGVLVRSILYLLPFVVVRTDCNVFVMMVVNRRCSLPKLVMWESER